MSIVSDLNAIHKEEDSEEDVWTSILEEVRHSMDTHLKKATVLIVGDRESGKFALVERLRSKDNKQRGIKKNSRRQSGLEYFYTDFADEESADARLDIWVSDGEGICAPMLEYAVNDQDLKNTLIIVTASMSEPWKLISSLESWFAAIENYFETLSSDVVESCRARRRTAFEDDWVPEFLLPTPLLVVITKTDTIVDLRKDYGYLDEHFEFIQMHLRMLCLRYGAGLLFTSNLKKPANDIFKEFVIQSCIHQAASNSESNQLDFENAFFPPGWDRSYKISALGQAFKHLDSKQLYTDVITKPTKETDRLEGYNTVLSAEVTAEGYQEFLDRFEMQLSRGPQSNESPTKPNKSPDAARRSAPSWSPGKKPQSTERVLSAFFHNLLAKPVQEPRPQSQSGDDTLQPAPSTTESTEDKSPESVETDKKDKE